MREILFRGKRTDNGEWVCSASIILGNKVDDGTVGRALMLQEGAKFRCADDYNDNVRAIDDTVFYKVDRSTIGQYTGLRDKNGKRIFEGDIVEWTGTRYVFKYLEKYARFAPSNPACVFSIFNYSACEVIGNIHDNPELLGGDRE